MQFDQLKRREFITLLGGAAAAWPVEARAQEATGVRRVAFLHPYAENDPEVLARVIAFREGVRRSGGPRTGISKSSIDIPVETWAAFEPPRRSWCVRHRTSSSEAGRRSLQH